MFWVRKMAGLFGYVDEYGHDRYVDQDNVALRKNYKYTADSDRFIFKLCIRSRCSVSIFGY